MAEDILEAEIFDLSADRNKTQLNISLSVTIAVCIVFLFLSMSFGEALSDENEVERTYDWWDVPLHERYKMDLPMDTMRAQLPENGTYDILPLRNTSSPSICQHPNKILAIQTRQRCTSHCGYLMSKKEPKFPSS